MCVFATVFELCKVSWEKREEKCFSHTRTHERTGTLVAARKEKQQNIFFCSALYIYFRGLEIDRVYFHIDI